MSVVPATKCNFDSQAFNSQTGSKHAVPDRGAGSLGSPGNGIPSNRYCS